MAVLKGLVLAVAVAFATATIAANEAGDPASEASRLSRQGLLVEFSAAPLAGGPLTEDGVRGVPLSHHGRGHGQARAAARSRRLGRHGREPAQQPRRRRAEVLQGQDRDVPEGHGRHPPDDRHEQLLRRGDEPRRLGVGARSDRVDGRAHQHARAGQAAARPASTGRAAATASGSSSRCRTSTSWPCSRWTRSSSRGVVAAGTDPGAHRRPAGRPLSLGRQRRARRARAASRCSMQTRCRPSAASSPAAATTRSRCRPTAAHALVTNRDDGTVSLIDVRTLKLVRTFKLGDVPMSAAYSTLSKAFYVADGKAGAVHVFRPDAPKAERRIALKPGIGPMRFTPDGRFLLALNTPEDIVHVIDVATNTAVHAIPIQAQPFQLEFTRDFAYVRSLGSERVSMINLGTLGRGKEPRVQSFAAGAVPPKAAGSLVLANSMVARRRRGRRAGRQSGRQHDLLLHGRHERRVEQLPGVRRERARGDGGRPQPEGGRAGRVRRQGEAARGRPLRRRLHARLAQDPALLLDRRRRGPEARRGAQRRRCSVPVRGPHGAARFDRCVPLPAGRQGERQADQGPAGRPRDVVPRPGPGPRRSRRQGGRRRRLRGQRPLRELRRLLRARRVGHAEEDLPRPARTTRSPRAPPRRSPPPTRFAEEEPWPSLVNADGWCVAPCSPPCCPRSRARTRITRSTRPRGTKPRSRSSSRCRTRRCSTRTDARCACASDVLGGRVVVVDFIYTTCTTICPIFTATMGARAGAAGRRRRARRATDHHDGRSGARHAASPQGLRGEARRKARRLVVPDRGPSRTSTPSTRPSAPIRRTSTTIRRWCWWETPPSGQWTRFYGFPAAGDLEARVRQLLAARKGAS